MGGPLRAGSLRVEVAVRERKVYVGAARADSLEELPQELAPDALVELPNGRRWLRKLDKLAIAQRWRSRFTASARSRRTRAGSSSTRSRARTRATS